MLLRRFPLLATTLACIALPVRALADEPVTAATAPSDAITAAPPSSAPSASPPPTSVAPLPETAATLPVETTQPRTPIVLQELTTPFAVAGWHNDVFYVSSPDHRWFVVPNGRLQLDGVAFTGGTDSYTTAAGVYRRADVHDGFLLRRARIELTAGLYDRVLVHLGSEFSSTTAPVAADVFANVRAFRELQFQIGQFDAPFTMENRTSDKYFDFLERSLAVRALGIPTNKEIGGMVWGETANRLVYYSFGVFNGDGQNRLNRDNQFDFLTRAFVHPFITMGGLLQNLQLGASFRYGQRGPDVDYAYAPMSTQNSFVFFNTTGVERGDGTSVTIVPFNEQLGVAAEFDLPIQRFDLRGEFVYVRNGTREMPAAAASLAGSGLRNGQLEGIGFYGQVGYWVWGTPGINGRPGYQNPMELHLDRPDAPLAQGIEVLLRFEGLDFRYNGGSRTGGASLAFDGERLVYGIDGGVNYWATRHIRVGIDYLQYIFPGQRAGVLGLTDNHAHGPHGAEGSYGEVTLRLGLAI